MILKRIIITLVVLLALLFGIFSYNFMKSTGNSKLPATSTVQTQSVAPMPASAVPPRQSMESANLSQKTVYRNEKYGFQIILPQGWEQYKMDERADLVRRWLAYIDFYLPTEDQRFTEINPRFPRMDEMGTIGVWPKEEWNREKTRCVKEGIDSSCPSDYAKIGQSDKYIFDFGSQQDIPDDLKDSAFDVSYFRENFSLISETKAK